MTSTKEEVEVSYDISNDFFRLWLDEGMHYTCAVFDAEHATLEEAQRNKCRILADYAGVTQDARVLDVGCGWGATLEYLVSERGVSCAHGITLSQAQQEWVEKRAIPGISTWCVDYRDFVPQEPYDALLSIEMVDHLVSPEQRRKGRSVDIYRSYFDRLAGWVRPGACFGFQAILRNRTPRTRRDLEDMKFTADVIFPGGLNPRLEELMAAAGRSWEILEVRTRREDYGRTTAEWLRRFRLHEDEIRSRWGGVVMSDGGTVWENYERFLTTCVRAFENHWSSDVQMRLRRLPG